MKYYNLEPLKFIIMKTHIKWFKNLPYKTQWNLSINNINHLDNLTDEDIFQIYNEQNPPLKS